MEKKCCLKTGVAQYVAVHSEYHLTAESLQFTITENTAPDLEKPQFETLIVVETVISTEFWQ